MRLISLLFSILLVLFIAACNNQTNKSLPQNTQDIHKGNEQQASSSPETDSDVLIIGAGIAGLSAAVDLARKGRTIIVVDMASIFGGHAVMSGGGMSIVDTPMQRERGIDDSPELALNDFITWGEDPNPEWVRYYVDHSKEDIFDWAVDLGIKFTRIIQPPGNSVPRMHFPGESGLGLVIPVYRATLKYPNIKFHWNTRADDLIFQDGRVIGVRVSGVRNQKTENIYARTIMIATGGFQGNLDLVRKNWRKDWPSPGRILIGAGWFAMGSGLKLAADVGAKIERLDYQWNYVSGIPDLRFEDGSRGLNFLLQYGKLRTDIWLNANGERFVNECLSHKFTLPEILKQPDQNYWVILDAKSKHSYHVRGGGWNSEKIQSDIFENDKITQSAQTLSELAEKTGIPEQSLIETVTRYNDLVGHGKDKDFGRFDLNDQKLARCNKIEKIDLPPFYAIKRYPLSRKSMGGIKINIQGQVVSTKGMTIPGLYAAGEVTGLAGINGKAGLEGTFLGPSIVTARVAARSIAEELLEIPVTEFNTGENDTVTAEIMTKKMNTEQQQCVSCHNIDTLITLERPGYKHFQMVHTMVSQQAINCMSCHSDMHPYDPQNHVKDAYQLTNVCVTCHQRGD